MYITMNQRKNMRILFSLLLMPKLKQNNLEYIRELIQP